MAEDGQITPEKQLLKLIEEGGAARGPAAQKARMKHAGASLFSFSAARGALFGWMSFFKRSSQKRSGKLKLGVSFKTVNTILILASLGLAAYLVADTFALGMSLMRPPNFVMQNDREPQSSGVTSSPLKDEASYVEQAALRNIFKEYKPPVARKVERTTGAAGGAKNDAVAGLTLVGISWSSNPDVILEDKERQKTYFLKRGMSFGDGMRVTSVFKDKVVVTVDDQEFEIK